MAWPLLIANLITESMLITSFIIYYQLDPQE